MNLLLDTSALLWWLSDNPRLGERARRAIAEPRNQIYVSAASAWEIATKAALGKLKVPDDPAQWLPGELEINDFTPLAITLEHALGVAQLPPHHADPFDRLIVAQARVEGFVVVTGDLAFLQYDVQIIQC